MEKDLNTKIKDAIKYTNVNTHGLTQSRKTFKVELIDHEVRGRYNGVFIWNMVISMSQKEWQTFDLAVFEWKLRDSGLGVKYGSEHDEEKDIKVINFTIREFYLKQCN